MSVDVYNILLLLKRQNLEFFLKHLHIVYLNTKFCNGILDRHFMAKFNIIGIT